MKQQQQNLIVEEEVRKRAPVEVPRNFGVKETM